MASTTHVALLGHPVAHSLSPRMQNAAFAATRLDWHYSAFDVEDALSAVAALRTLGFAGANVTVPHKRAVVAACDEAEGDAINTLVFRDGRVLGFNTDQAILAGIEARRVCLIGAGGAAEALRPALHGEVHVFNRSGDWPPDASGCAWNVQRWKRRHVLGSDRRAHHVDRRRHTRPELEALHALPDERLAPFDHLAAGGAGGRDERGVVAVVDRISEVDDHLPCLRLHEQLVADRCRVHDQLTAFGIRRPGA